MSGRKIFIGVATAVVLTILYHLRSVSVPDVMTTSGSSTDVSASDLTVKLEQDSSNPPVLRATIHNANPTSAITILTWDSPFDPSALNLGVFRLVDSLTGSELNSPEIKINRRLPPPRDALLEIAPGAEVTREIKLKKPWIPTSGDRRYKVTASGRWRSAWGKPSSHVRDQELRELGGENALTGEFKTEEIEITL